MANSLKKQLEKYQKIDDLKLAKEKEIYSYRDSAIKSMIEKEKLLEAIAAIWKSPRSKTAQEKLKSLNMYSKEPSMTESDQ
jgi:hypothetical protein